MPSIADLQKQGVLQGITFTTTVTSGTANPLHALLNNDVYLYAQIKGVESLYPIDVIDDEAGREISMTIQGNTSVNGRVFYTEHKAIHSSTEQAILFGQSSRTRILPGQSRWNLSFTPKHCPSLRQRATDLEFFIAFMEAKGFDFNGMKCGFDMSTDTIEAAELDKRKKTLECYQKMIHVLDMLHIKKDIDLNEMTEDEWNEFGLLVKALIDNEPLRLGNNTMPGRVDLMLCGLHISLMRHPPENGVYHVIPSYAQLDIEGWEEIDNIDYDSVVPSFREVYSKEKDNSIFPIATNTLLAILLAYDKERRSELLATALELSKWILEESPDSSTPYPIRLLNYLQTIKRQRELNRNEVRQLAAIAEDETVEEQFRVGANLLLGNQAAAEIHFERLSEDKRRSFKEFPIYSFWQGSLNETTSILTTT